MTTPGPGPRSGDDTWDLAENALRQLAGRRGGRLGDPVTAITLLASLTGQAERMIPELAADARRKRASRAGIAAALGTRLALPLLTARGGGNIVTIASVNAAVPDPLVIDYSAAKAALANFCKALSQEVGPHGIRVNTISPGPVATDLRLGSGGVAETVAAWEYALTTRVLAITTAVAASSASANARHDASPKPATTTTAIAVVSLMSRSVATIPLGARPSAGGCRGTRAPLARRLSAP